MNKYNIKFKNGKLHSIKFTRYKLLGKKSKFTKYWIIEFNENCLYQDNYINTNSLVGYRIVGTDDFIELGWRPMNNKIGLSFVQYLSGKQSVEHVLSVEPGVSYLISLKIDAETKSAYVSCENILDRGYRLVTKHDISALSDECHLLATKKPSVVSGTTGEINLEVESIKI